MPLDNAVLLILFLLLAFSAVAGLIAIVHPRTFQRISDCLNLWVDAEKHITLLDKRFDIDDHVLRHSRVFGAVVVSACLLFTLVWLLA